MRASLTMFRGLFILICLLMLVDGFVPTDTTPRYLLDLLSHVVLPATAGVLLLRAAGSGSTSSMAAEWRMGLGKLALAIVLGVGVATIVVLGDRAPVPGAFRDAWGYLAIHGYVPDVSTPQTQRLAALIAYSVVTAGVGQFVLTSLLFRALGPSAATAESFVGSSILLFALLNFENGFFDLAMLTLLVALPSALYYWRFRSLGFLVAAQIVFNFLHNLSTFLPYGK